MAVIDVTPVIKIIGWGGVAACLLIALQIVAKRWVRKKRIERKHQEWIAEQERRNHYKRGMRQQDPQRGNR